MSRTFCSPARDRRHLTKKPLLGNETEQKLPICFQFEPQRNKNSPEWIENANQKQHGPQSFGHGIFIKFCSEFCFERYKICIYHS